MVLISCRNKCKYNIIGSCTNEQTIQEFSSEDTVFVSVDKCSHEEKEEIEDEFEIDRLLFQSYLDQEADGYFD